MIKGNEIITKSGDTIQFMRFDPKRIRKNKGIK